MLDTMAMFSLFESPANAEKRRAREVKYFDEVLAPQAISWDEDTIKFDKNMIIDGETYKPHQLFKLRPTRVGKVLPKRSVRYSPDRNFAYMNRILPRAGRLELFQGHKHGSVRFTTDVVVPVLVNTTEKNYEAGTDWSVWMSITPAEVLTQRAGIRKATGTVMVGGLGLGYMLRKIAEKKSVKRIIVVEISQELLDWYGTDMCKRYEEEHGKPIEVICGDAKDHVNQHGEDVRHVVDIWDSFPTSHWELNRNGWNDVIRNTRYFWGWGLIADPADYR